MNVLVITGDKTFKPGHPRYDLQRSAVEELVCVYWGRRSVWPSLPDGDFDVVTSQDPFVRGVYAWRAAKRLKARFNVQVHADLDAQSWWKHILAGIVLRHADSVRVVSEKIKTQVERMGGRNITVLPVYIDISSFVSVVRREHEGNNILWVGRFEDEKDPLFAIEVLKEVLKAEPSARLTMLGAGSMTERLRHVVQGLPVTFPGWQDSRQYLAEADVALSTSPAESYGASVVEALAAGVPAVSLDVGVAREAGAIAVPRTELAGAVIKALQAGERGELKLQLLHKETWLEAWKKSLI